MSDGTLRADGTIECVWHGARFDAAPAVCRGPPRIRCRCSGAVEAGACSSDPRAA